MMPSLSRLAEGCRECPYVAACNHKRMQTEAYMMPLTSGNMPSAAIPSTRETMVINIGGVMTSMYKDEIQKKIQDELFKERFGLMFGA